MINYDLHTLATQKSFAELSDAERDFVLSKGNQIEYDQIRTIILRAASLHNQTQPSTALRQHLLNQMAVQKPKKIQKWYETPVSVWKTASIAAIAAAITFAIKPPLEPITVEKWSERIVHTTDTIQLKSNLKTITKTKWRERIVYVNEPQVQPIVYQNNTDTIYLQANNTDNYPSTEGVAASKNPAFWSFLNNGR
jgi:hypothetical protein